MNHHFPPRLETIDIAPWKGYCAVAAIVGLFLGAALWFNLR